MNQLLYFISFLLNRVQFSFQNDIISIDYLGKEYEVQIMELKPENAVNIIECDMNVDFEAPVGYQEPERIAPTPEGY